MTSDATIEKRRRKLKTLFTQRLAQGTNARRIAPFKRVYLNLSERKTTILVVGTFTRPVRAIDETSKIIGEYALEFADIPRIEFKSALDESTTPSSNYELIYESN